MALTKVLLRDLFVCAVHFQRNRTLAALAIKKGVGAEALAEPTGIVEAGLKARVAARARARTAEVLLDTRDRPTSIT